MEDARLYYRACCFILGILGVLILLLITASLNPLLDDITENKDLKVLKEDSIGRENRKRDTDTIVNKKTITKVDTLEVIPTKVTLNDESLLKEIHAHGVVHPKIVLAQAKLETGNYTSKVCRTHNNLFGLRKPNGSYYRFKHWRESVKAYRDLVQYKYKPHKYKPPGNHSYYKFLADIGYAENKSYIEKVKKIVSQL